MNFVCDEEVRVQLQAFRGPEGPVGPAGKDGQDGKDGGSPKLSAYEIDGGHRVNIRDANGYLVQSFDVMDGKDGQDGAGSALEVASPVRLGGVMPAEKTDDMTQAVGVDAEGGLWTNPGTGGETLVVEPTLLATGTIPAETGANTHIVTGLTLGDLRAWKMFIIRIASANVKQGNMYFSVKKTDGSLNSFVHSTGQSGWAVIVSWADTARTALVMNGGAYDKAGISVNSIGKNAPTGIFYNGNSDGSSWNGHNVAVFDSDPDTADAVFHSLSAFSAEFVWDIWGMIK